MFGDILSKLDGWFGKSFVVSSLLPVLLFGGASVLLAQFVFPDSFRQALAYFASWPLSPLSFTAALLVACAILAYLTDPLARFSLNLLRGVNWPDPLKHLGVADETAALRQLDAKKRAAGDLRERVTEPGCEGLKSKLIDARVKGNAFGSIVDRLLIVSAEPHLRKLQSIRARGETIDFPALEAAVDALAAALEKNCSDTEELVVINLGSGDEKSDSEWLDTLFTDLSDMIDYARKRAESEWTQAVNRRNSRMPRKNVAPTQLGNKYAALNDYLDGIFSIDIDFFLPIIGVILLKDKETSDLLASAQQRLDFAARSFVLAVLFTAAWLGVFVFALKSSLDIAVLGSAGLVVVLLIIAVIEASFDSYSEVIRAICILKRFEVLGALHMKLPVNWAAERHEWELINQQLQWGSARGDEIDYEHPAK
jgi:hypothetical protein